MPRRGGRLSSSSSLHIQPKVMSGINNAEVDPDIGDEPKVVVQTLPAVEPAEERLTPAPHSTTAQQQFTTETDDKSSIEEVRTRLRPHRSSWRDKYSTSEKEETKKAITVGLQNTPIKGNVDYSKQQNKTSTESSKQPSPVQPSRRSSADTKQNKWNYASEDVASIERNKKRQLQRERTPSTDSAPESSPIQKRRVKSDDVKPTGKPKPSSADNNKSSKQQKVLSVKKLNVTTTQHNGKHVVVILKQSGEKQTKNTSKGSSSNITVQGTVETKLQADDAVQFATDFPGFCEYCGEEYAYLNTHMETKHNKTIVRSTSPTIFQNSQQEISSKQVDIQQTTTAKQDSAMLKAQIALAKCVAKEEALQIVTTVRQDGLIQKFGVRLLGMSVCPKEKVMTVSQRMIELVRLLRAAQGFDPNIQCLAQLLHCDQWPVITEAIMYVAGYQEEDCSFRNPVFVFDVGQALKFAAYILKTEAAQNNNLQHEQDLKEFMNSIDAKIQEILPTISELKNVHFMDTQIHTLDSSGRFMAKGDIAGEVSEERQVQALLDDISSSTNPQCSSSQNLTEEFILSDVLEEAVTSSVELASSFVVQDNYTHTESTTVQVSEPGVQQASLLLGLSRAQPSSSSIVSVVPHEEKTAHAAAKLTKLSPVNVQGAKTLTNLKIIKAASVSTNKPANPPIRFVKIVSSKNSAAQDQPVQRKFCLLIPSQTVSRQSVKNAVQNIGKVTTNTAEASPSKANISLQIVQQPSLAVSEVDNVTPTSTSLPTTTDNEPPPRNQSLAALCGLNLDALTEES